MVYACCVSFCGNRPSRRRVMKFYTFPKDKNRCQKWLKSLKLINDEDDEFGGDLTKLTVCSDHFEASDFYMAGMIKKLRKGCVPSITKNKSAAHEGAAVLSGLAASDCSFDFGISTNDNYFSNSLNIQQYTHNSFQTLDTEFVDTSVTIKQEPLRDDLFSDKFLVAEDLIEIKQEPVQDPLKPILKPEIEKDTDSTDLDPVDLTCLGFAKRIKLLSAETRTEVNREICRLLAEAEMKELELKQRSN